MTDPAAMLLDEIMPVADAARADHRVVPGAPDDVYRTVREVDFGRAWRESPAVRVLFEAREVAERVAATVRGAPAVPEPAWRATDLRRFSLAGMPTHGDWVRLGERPPHDIAFGAIGRFWAGETRWVEIDAGDFASFAEPGLARIACNFSLRPYGADQTLVTYECRTRATDDEARRGFLRYWRALSPFVGVVMRAQLKVIADAR